MVAGLLHPLNIFIVGLGGAFLIPLLYRLGGNAVAIALVLALGAMTLISGVALWQLAQGGGAIEILTGGAKPPLAINLRLGLPEAIFVFSVNLVALFGAPAMLREKYGVVLIYLLIVMGIQGMVMTRDLFNLFVFLEIVSIATYGLLSLRDTPAALSATFKYLMATVLASGFFLIGTALLYAVTGQLNIDDLIADRASIIGPIGIAALIFLLGALLLELKPFPANGWGLDVYETARPDVAALISGGVSAGVFFAFFKLLPLFERQLPLIAILAAITFVFSNLIGLRQTKTQRLLGYSSIGQMALLMLAAALLHGRATEATVLLVVGGLFVNHLFAKVGLFWLAGYIGKPRLRDGSLAGRPAAIVVLGMLIAAIAGLPPFPGFFAKWQFIMILASDQRCVFIAVILFGSLLEAAYMFRWFGHVVHGDAEVAPSRESGGGGLLPIYAIAAMLLVAGCVVALLVGIDAFWVALPLAAGLVVWLLYPLPMRLQGVFAGAIVLIAGLWLIRDLSGLAQLYAVILLAGGLVVSIGSLHRSDPCPGFHPLLVVMLVSLPALPRATTSLEFLVIWELITLSSYFLVLQRRSAASHALIYLLFSLAAAFFLLAGFATMHAATGTLSLSAFRTATPDVAPVFVLLAIGLLIKAGAAGVHIWLPGTYAEADDDVSALLSAVISKVAIFGLLVGTYIAIRSEVGLNLAQALGWIGMLTTLVGAILAVRQDDIKRMLAYSSMSQLGYIVAAIALMSHLGWVTALYLVANHLLVKGILFLVAAAVILRTGTRLFSDLGGLARAMPQTFALAAIAIVAMSGLPPLAGFGGKWLLLSAMLEKNWYGSALMLLLATFVGFLYMARFMQAFFGAGRSTAAADAPVTFLIPQYLLVAGILVMSFFPKLLIEPVSAAIDPQFASTLRWQGMSLELIYATWDPAPVMAVAVAVAAALFVLLRYARRAWPLGGVSDGIYAYAQRVAAALTPPLAIRSYAELTNIAAFAAERSRRIYTGDGRAYNLYIAYYLLVLYAFGGGAQQLWNLALAPPG